MGMQSQQQNSEVDAVTAWAKSTEVVPVHVDCVTAVMLKILDGKCKMNEAEKVTMEILYDAVKDRSGQLLDSGVHDLIATTRSQPTIDLLEKVYEHRLLAETAISRPVMKGFKRMLREQGVLPQK